MGYYRDREGRQKHVGSLSSWKWVAVVVVSALVGSGATLAAQTAMPHRAGLTATTTGTTSATGATTSANMGSGVSKDVSVTVNDGVTKAVKRVEPDVVGVENYTKVANYFTQQSKLEATGVGTGVMFFKDNKSAYLVTNNHVVEGAAKVDIVLKSGKHVDATVVGTDPYTDLAVIKVPASTFKGVKPITFANSDDIQPGEPAIAIGTPMGLDFADTVTSGIVSAKSRVMPVQDEQSKQTLDYQSVIQTDAAINPGNSGGPLIDINGDVIGINSSKIVAPNFEGMGFAIPSNEVQNIAKQLMDSGHAEHPALGIEAYSLASLPQQMWPDVPVDYGVWVKSVTSNETKQDGLKPGDVIVSFNGKVVKTVADLRTYLFKTHPGDTATIKVYRDSKAITLKIKVGSMDTQLTTASAQKNQNNGGSADPLNPFGGIFQ